MSGIRPLLRSFVKFTSLTPIEDQPSSVLRTLEIESENPRCFTFVTLGAKGEGKWNGPPAEFLV